MSRLSETLQSLDEASKKDSSDYFTAVAVDKIVEDQVITSLTLTDNGNIVFMGSLKENKLIITQFLSELDDLVKTTLLKVSKQHKHDK